MLTGSGAVARNFKAQNLFPKCHYKKTGDPAMMAQKHYNTVWWPFCCFQVVTYGTKWLAASDYLIKKQEGLKKPFPLRDDLAASFHQREPLWQQIFSTTRKSKNLFQRKVLFGIKVNFLKIGKWGFLCLLRPATQGNSRAKRNTILGSNTQNYYVQTVLNCKRNEPMCC